jgi:alpha-mannosidase
MLKHTDLTLRRAKLFLNELKASLYSGSAPLKIEFNPAPAKTQKEAEKGQWCEVQPGFQWGPAYRVVWFRVSGTVPKEYEGHEVKAILDVGGERTVWRDNTPVAGVDYEHTDFGVLGGASAHLPNAKPGKPIQLVLQAYARNPQARVHLKELPRDELVETIGRVELVTFDRDVQSLIYDFEFVLSLCEGFNEKDPSHTTLVRALNECINSWAVLGRDCLGRCRKLLKDAMGSLNGELKHTVTPVGHAHLDTAWLWPISITKLKMAHTTATQLGLMERYPWYVFAHSQASQYEWLEKEYPKLFDRVKEAIGRGQWEPVGSMWVEADCNLTGGESLIRQFLYGRAYFREKLGYETEDMFLPDVFGYSAALPQILNKFGIKYFLTQKISWNQFNKFPHNTFWWQGIDGSRIWSHFPPADTYVASCEPKEVINSVLNHKDHARSDSSLYLFGFGDGGGGPTERHLELLHRGRLAPHYPELGLGKKAIDFYEEARARSKDLMTWVGELYLELHRGTYTSQAANKRNNRKSEFLLRDAEWLAAFAGDLSRYPAGQLEKAWKLVLLNQFHDIIPGSSVREVYVDSDADYEKVFEIGERVVESSLKQIGAKIGTEGLSRPVALFQSSAVASQGEIPWSEEWTPTALVVGEEGSPLQLVEEFGERKLIFATPPSALGTVAVADLLESHASPTTRLKASGRKLENSEWAVRFDGNGNISSIQSLEDGTEFIRPGKPGNVFQMLDDKPLFWSAWDVDVFAHETVQEILKCESIEIVERGPVRAAIEVVRRFSNSTIRQRISLGPTPGIRFDTEVDWQEEDKMLKVAFPLNVNASRATFEIQFGSVERPTHVNTSWDLAKFEVCAQKWADLSEGDQGVALLNQGKYGHDVRGSVLRLSLLRSPKAPDPLCDMGVHRFSYSLLPHFGPHHQAGVVAAAYAFNAPVRYAFLDRSVGESGALPPLVACDSRNVVIESVKRAEDGDGIIVRLYECHNVRGRAELSCVRVPREAVLCDLEENEVGALEIAEGSVRFDYKPFEIITVRLRC